MPVVSSVRYSSVVISDRAVWPSRSRTVHSPRPGSSSRCTTSGATSANQAAAVENADRHWAGPSPIELTFMDPTSVERFFQRIRLRTGTDRIRS